MYEVLQLQQEVSCLMCHIYGHSMMKRASGKGKGEFYELRGASENRTLANTAVFIIAAALERIYTKGSRGANKKTRGGGGWGRSLQGRRRNDSRFVPTFPRPNPQIALLSPRGQRSRKFFFKKCFDLFFPAGGC